MTNHPTSVPCPVCQAAAGAWCRTPKRLLDGRPHRRRVRAYRLALRSKTVTKNVTT